MLMTLLGRETPESLPEVLFSDLEIEVLNAYAKKMGKKETQAVQARSLLCYLAVREIGMHMAETFMQIAIISTGCEVSPYPDYGIRTQTSGLEYSRPDAVSTNQSLPKRGAIMQLPVLSASAEVSCDNDVPLYSHKPRDPRSATSLSL